MKANKNPAHVVSILWRLARFEFSLKYSDSIFGYLWHLSLPLLTFGTVLFASANLMHQKAALKPPALLLSSIVWGFFREATLNASSGLLGKGLLLENYAVRPWYLVVGLTVAPFFSLILNLAGGCALCFLLMGVRPGGQLGWLPFYLFELFVFVLALNLFLACACVHFRDLHFAWGSGLQVIIWTVPVFYSGAVFSDGVGRYYFLNPLANLIDSIQSTLTGLSFVVTPWPAWTPCFIGLLFIVSCLFYRGLAPTLVERL